MAVSCSRRIHIHLYMVLGGGSLTYIALVRQVFHVHKMADESLLVLVHHVYIMPGGVPDAKLSVFPTDES